MAEGFVMRNALFTLDGDAFAAVLKKALLVPATQVQSYTTLVPSGVKTDVGTPVWTLELEGLQSFAADELARVLHDGHGVEMVAVLGPQSTAGKRKATFTVIGQSVPFGGETGEFATIDVKLGVVGQPVFSDISA